AYDTNGNPLYAAPPPPVQTYSDSQHAPQVVHLTRSIDPVQQEVTPEVKAKHDKSVHEHPSLNLSSHEYIISAVRRHPIGLLIPAGLTVFLIALVASILINFPIIVESLGIFDPPAAGPIWLIGLLLMALFTIGGYIAIWVYMNNRFFLTNESVIQELQLSLFMRKEQTVSLANIEDASFDQHGIMQTLLNYGSIRLSTEGDETTYRFTYVTNPKKQIEILNNAVEAFKNGRPVDES
ncbi:MAG: hypothetical protein JWM07_557, partial [Candidatus Saccharibacteria bacterium]|nr:hypothetical protein [Candidatus Saccharibacteria bacterium]